jgi:hypothetical protein
MIITTPLMLWALAVFMGNIVLLCVSIFFPPSFLAAWATPHALVSKYSAFEFSSKQS